MKSEKLMLCAIVLQLILAFAFAFFVEYGDAAIAKYKWQLYEAFGGTSGKNTLPPNYYSKFGLYVEICISLLSQTPVLPATSASHF